jgi:multidrug efflux system outer membrane protein
VATADFFPRLSLTGLFGQSSADLAAITSGTSLAYSFGAGIVGPLFHGGALTARLHQARAAEREAFFRYQSTVLNAMQEVSNSLIGREKYAASRVQQQRAVNAYKVAVEVATERYIAGRAGYFEVLQEQQLLFPAENNLNQVELNHVLATVQLYRALGGGWESTGF